MGVCVFVCIGWAEVAGRPTDRPLEAPVLNSTYCTVLSYSDAVHFLLLSHVQCAADFGQRRAERHNRHTQQWIASGLNKIPKSEGGGRGSLEKYPVSESVNLWLCAPYLYLNKKNSAAVVAVEQQSRHNSDDGGSGWLLFVRPSVPSPSPYKHWRTLQAAADHPSTSYGSMYLRPMMRSERASDRHKTKAGSTQCIETDG